MKNKLLLLSAFLFLTAIHSIQGQTLVNTTNTITLTGTCLSIPAGSYTLTIHYTDLVSGSTGDNNYSASVAVTASVITITASGAAFPTVSSTGYYDLSDVTLGMIYLTDGTHTGTLRWNVHSFSCAATIPTVTLTSASTVLGPMDVFYNTTGSGLVSGAVYRSTDGGATFYLDTHLPDFNGTFQDGNFPPHPGPNDSYYFAVTTSDGSCILTNSVSGTCSGCTYTPTHSTCSDFITGPNHICNLQDHQTYTLTNSYPIENRITWSVNPAGGAYIFPDPCHDNTQATLIRTGYTGVVTLRATESVCLSGTPQTIGILMGLPTTLHPSWNINGYTGNSANGSATCDNLPGNVDGDFHWTLNLGVNGTTNYTGRNINFTLPPCSGGSLRVSVNTLCGNVQDGVTVFNSHGCGGFMRMSPNPASGSVTISASTTSSARKLMTAGANVDLSIQKVEVFDKSGTRLISRNCYGVPSFSLDLSSLKPDIYTLQVQYGKEHSVEALQLVVH